MTDEELKELASKVGMAIKLENPKARYALTGMLKQGSIGKKAEHW